MIRPPWFSRVAALGAVFLALFMVLEARLWSMQAIQGPYYLRLSEQNRLRDYVIPAPRGVIYDRRGQPLVTNRAAFTVGVLPMEVRDPERLAEALAPVLGMDRAEILQRYAAGRQRPFEPVTLRRDVPKTVVMTLEEYRLDLPGVLVQAEPVRDHLRGEVAAHALGYLGEITEDELKTRRGYRAGSLIGKSGVERVYDGVLRGIDGRQRVEVDAAGRPVRVLSREAAHPGQSLVLNLDADLQAVAEAALGNRNGAVVAMDPRNGEVLVMVAHPAFDPNQFAGGISPANWKRLTGDRRVPLLNRATEGTYEPGSVFKIVTGLAALSEGVATRDTMFNCTGQLALGRWIFHDLHAYGPVNFMRGVAVSCNVVFWTLGRALGDERLHRYARMLGLGQPTGIDLPAEASGIVPSAQWKAKTYKEPWWPGETLNMAIGQGYVLTTPVQVARMVSAVANGGTLFAPRLARRVVAPDGSTVTAYPPVATGRLTVPPEALATLREALRMAVESGTGTAAAVPGLPIAGKTGSAENPRGIPHAWFAGFAPADRPALVVVAFVEHGFRGGVTAAPIARAVFAAAQQTLQAAAPADGARP
jgi:penicillin-binding protein 2